jgi:iron(II)-dependent oxidoreductase
VLTREGLHVKAPFLGFVSNLRIAWPGSRRRAVIFAAAGGLLGLLTGMALSLPWLSFLSGVVVLCAGGFFLGERRAERSAVETQAFRTEVTRAVATRRPRGGSDTTTLVEEMLDQGRYALLLRPQLAGNLTPDQRRRAERMLDEDMRPIPAGDLLVGMAGEDLVRAADEGLPWDLSDRLLAVDEFLLDRYPVTNRQYYEFVASGGYGEMAIWDPQIWPAVSSFLDQTGQSGPRFWRHGTYEPGAADHPVVGVSWFEAAAYARWVGKRLPTEPEWEKAASWPVHLPDSHRLQRRFPWGDTFDSARANVWTSGAGTTVAVDQRPEGASAAGIQQLAGNVWEWTLDDFVGDGLLLPAPMKAVRGGAFDTYFECQATCQFRSGEISANRRHNIGFRCAVSVCDVRPADTPPSGGVVDEDSLQVAEPDREVVSV